MKNYEGKYMKGFEFEDLTDNVVYDQNHEKFIGKIGRIDKEYETFVLVSFIGNALYYPKSLINKHLIKKPKSKKYDVIIPF
jgi:hypothetical protein